MKSVKRIFNKIRNKNPFWSDYNCFAEAMLEKRSSRKTIICNFNSLVDREEYAESEKKKIVEFPVELSKRAEEG